MFCPECGVAADGKFCWSCGNSLARPGRSAVALRDRPSDLPQAGWEDEPDYERLLRHPVVRQRLVAAALSAKRRMSGEEFLALCDKVFEPAVGVSLAKIGAVAGPLFAKLGVGTGKRRTAEVALPIGKAIVGTLGFLARNGYALRQVAQADGGCVVTATIPSDVWSGEGELVVSVRATGRASIVEAATRIGGQYFDWGKSSRCLDRLFDDLRP